ncbi:MAG TPA: ATP-binding protein [Spirochaetota bacterium]|nr:MAG: Alkaline phosphatase synthesis sensor protein PhoR [Spirochaetes bacterium ADurb.Bin133]HPY87570.1 ATP-binding protein [Spirochaetota bacterium]
MKNKSIVIKYLSIFIALVVLYYITITIFYVPKLKRDNIAIATDNLSNIINILEYNLKSKPFDNSDKLDEYIKDVSTRLNVRITILNESGRVISDSDENPKFMDNHLDRPEIALSLKNGLGVSSRRSSTLNEDMLYIAKKITEEDKTIGFIRISSFLKNINKITLKYALNIMVFTLILAILSVVCILLIYFDFKKSIIKFSNVSKRVSEGEFNVKFDVDNNFESATLAHSFNSMTEKLRDIFEELSNEKEELRNIISNIKDGIAVIDKDGKISRVNDSFKKIVSHNNPENKYYWEILRERDFENILNDAASQIKFENIEMIINYRVYIVSVSYISRSKDTVVVFYDVTKINELDTIKKEYVSNLGHELNTPLTSINGYVETILEENDINLIKKYMLIVDKNVQRLISIVKDILILSKLDEKKYTLTDKIDLKTLIEDILPIFSIKLKNKNLDLEFRYESDLPQITGDSFKLEQLFINLIDNAVKYTEEGSISINIFKDNGSIVVEVADSGVGIPKSEFDKIFNRFYVVDKSRSREKGGAGLGLSIVKNIALDHNAKILVESETGKGSKFKAIFSAEDIK